MIAAFRVDPDFQDPHAVSPLNKQIREQRIAFMESKFGDRPDLMEKMIPVAPPMSSRPVLVDRDYSIYDVLLRDDVTLVTDGDPADHAGRHRARGRHRASIWTSSSWPPASRPTTSCGRWRSAVATASGCRSCGRRTAPGPTSAPCCPGFPNLFMLYGPNTNQVGGLQIVDVEEMVTRFALECIGGLITEGKRSVDVTTDAYWRYNASSTRPSACGSTSTRGPTTTTRTSTAARPPTGPSTPGSCGTGSAARPRPRPTVSCRLSTSTWSSPGRRSGPGSATTWWSSSRTQICDRPA